MQSENLENCPKCQGSIITLNTGKLVCRSCGWTSSNKTEINDYSRGENINETDLTNIKSVVYTLYKNNTLFSSSSLAGGGKLLFFLGLLTMIITFFAYETAICDKGSYSKDCTYNIGLLNEKSNLINLGGFIFLGGCILIVNNKKS